MPLKKIIFLAVLLLLLYRHRVAFIYVTDAVLYSATCRVRFYIKPETIKAVSRLPQLSVWVALFCPLVVYLRLSVMQLI